MSRPLRALIIEDSEDDLILLLRELRRGGYDPSYTQIQTEQELQTALGREGWDVVISDYVLPGFSGLAALEVLKACSADIPFIIVSGKIGEDIAVGAMKAGAHDYIVKGNLSRLVPAIERELRDAESRRKSRRTEEELRVYREHLEDMVNQRTSELKQTNEQLQGEIAKRKEIAAELREHRDHLDLMVRERTAELRRVNKDLRGEIMRRIQMEKDLIESQRFVHSIADATPTLLYLYDIVEDKSIYINPRVRDILGYSAEEVRRLGYSFFRTLVHPDDAPIVDSLRDRFVDAPEGTILESEYRIRNAAGEWRWFYSRDVSFKRDDEGMLKIILGIAQDITEKKQAEQELRKSREQLRSLLAHQQSVREDERARISREIHDELGQSLTALKMDVSWLLKRFGPSYSELVEKARAMTLLIDQNIKTVKRIAAELRPGLLDDLGLTAALEWQTEEFRNRTGIACQIEIAPEDIRLDRDLSTVIFRIFQETLTNVARHARAQQVRVSLAQHGREVILSVEDDGIGITEKQLASPLSIGLIGMRERVAFLNGTLSIWGSEGKGTTVTVTLPVSDRENSAV